MKYDLDALPPEWREFAKRHQKADPEVLDWRAFGRDEQLDEMLDAMSDGTSLTAEQLATLRKNRSRKHWLRGNHLRRLHAERKGAVADAAEAPAIVADEVSWARRNSSERDWQAFVLVSDDEAYASAAVKLGVTLAALRSRLSRCRRRLRQFSTAS